MAVPHLARDPLRKRRHISPLITLRLTASSPHFDRPHELQLLVNQEARATTGCFRTTNLGALSMESGLRAATAQLENRQRRFGLRLLSLPRGDQGRGIVGAKTAIGRRLTNALAHRGQTESTVLLEEPEILDAELRQEEEAEARVEAERARPGLTMFTDGSRLENGATGYAVVWRRGRTWAGAKVHMGSNQEAYGAECAALARTLEEASKRNTIPERVTIFTDAQAAIRRMASDEPGPGQQYALQARKHIATLHMGQTRHCHRDPVVPSVQGGRRQRKSGRVGQGGSGAGRRPQAYPTISRQPQAGNLGEEMGGGTPMGGGPNLQEEVPVACEPAAQWYSSREHQKAHLAVLPAQDGALPDRAIPQLDKELPHPAILVVPVPNTDPGPPLQGVPGMETVAEDSVGDPEKGDGEVEGLVEGVGLTGQWEVQPGGAGLPFDHGHGQVGAGCGG